MQNQQNLISSPKESQRLALKDEPKSKDKLDELLGTCLALQKLYGRDVANSDTIIELFQRMMGKYEAGKVIHAFETWMERSQEFPTPSDIIGLIKRAGRPPLSESMFVQISKKDGEDRTPDDWQYLRDYQAFMNDGWQDDPDPVKQAVIVEENNRLRQEIHQLRAECTRAWEAARTAEARAAKAFLQNPPPVPSRSDKVAATIATMKADGVPQEIINEFAAAEGYEQTM